ncbi:hypothetical protein AB0K16_25930 [Nonomuraea jabiensis]|uniref:SbtR family transcriptional regulator n=1 Tax=Nonomuraea jabiensis TaxID=882448 RepID=UPI0034473577
MALLSWLGDVVAYCVAARGLAAALSYEGAEPGSYEGAEPGSDEGAEPGSVHENTCSAMMEKAGDPLLRRAVRDGVVADGVKGVNILFMVVSCRFVSASWSEQWPGSGMLEARDAPSLLYDLLPHRGLADAAAP